MPEPRFLSFVGGVGRRCNESSRESIFSVRSGPKCAGELRPKTHADLPQRLLDLCCTGQARLLRKVVIPVPFLALGLKATSTPWFRDLAP